MKNKIFFGIFMAVWAIMIILNFIWPKQTFSASENRMLAVIPRFSFDDFVSGEYLGGIDSYINDHFAFRDFYLKLNSWWEIDVMGKKENNDVYIGKDNFLFEKFAYGDEQKNNVLKNITAVSNFAEDMQKNNINTFFILVPNSIYINADKLPNNVEVPNQAKIIEEIYTNTKNTHNVNVTQVLAEENKNQQLYFKTDHHMNSDGAYIVYREFCNSADISPVSLFDFDREVIAEDFLGTFDSKAQIYGQKPDTIWVYKNDMNTNIKEAIYDKEKANSIFNENYLQGKDKYSYFLNGNNSKVVVKTNVENTKKLLVIKDSYAHIMSQFLCQNYSEVHFLDPRYTNFNYEEYIQENGITDILFLYNVSTFVQDKDLYRRLVTV